MNYDVWGLKQIQNFQQMLVIAMSKNIHNVDDLSRFMQSYIDKESAKIAKGIRREPHIKSEFKRAKAEQTKMMLEQKELESALPPCPKCKTGRLILACYGTVQCSTDCGYSALRSDYGI